MELLDPIKTFLTDLADRDQLWILHAFAVVLATLVVAMVVSFIVKRLEKKADSANAIWLMMAFRSVRPPLKGIIWLMGISWASYLTHQGADIELMGAVETIRQVGIVLLVTWFLVRFIRLGEKEFLNPRVGEPGDPTTVGAVSKLLRASVVITAVLGLLQALGYSISGVLAFGGVGGIAVGFAAKDLLANFFGGLTIYMDRPFAVGDWVRSPDKEIEGVVENIGWRQTRIRTFDRRPLYVPNATFTQISVENPSRMENRRILETIGIRYDDVDKMDDIVADVRQMLLDDERIETDHQTLIVNFNSFAASSLDFFVYTFTKTVNWVEFHEIKQDVMLKIADIIAGYGAEIAFPTSTLHVPEPVRLSGHDGGGASQSERESPAENKGADRASGKNQEPSNRSAGDATYGPEVDGEQSGGDGD
ncbi:MULTISPECIES: mechanosensitive ion channel family protein [unclassified Marinimicrobium]|jgi:MscS family membrane protein|uniref:mechanosensitive ion channel family protein n=1 Tax=unclassified Marinimicrobium TaxID=2632100 RepID=UPI002579455E|nr:MULTISPECIES: mechanosensitive ion channel family protein [unclassified Marinimicrobium]|tara:strand:- start:228 stop:1487 length:1260 start_codon:yes stop_codon:yes gene_type:complete